MMSPGESPEDLKILCQSMIRKSGCSVEQVWVMNDYVGTEPGTAVLFTCDHLLGSFLDFVKKGRSHHQAAKFLRLIGDATHEKTSQGLKKFVLGVAGTHFHNGKWANTILPIMFVALSQESKPNLKRAIDALIACVQLRLDINFVDLVLEWF